MARGINKVILIGNLGADPETRAVPSGTTVANLRIATSESWRDKQTGEQQERTEWHRVAFFGRLAEVAGEYLRKGSQVYIEGSLRTRKWQDKQGNERYSTEIIGNDLQMLGGRGGAGGSAAPGAGGGGASPGRAGGGGGDSGKDFRFGRPPAAPTTTRMVEELAPAPTAVSVPAGAPRGRSPVRLEMTLEEAVEFLQHLYSGIRSGQPVVFTRQCDDGYALSCCTEGMRHPLRLLVRHDRVACSIDDEYRNLDRCDGIDR